MGAAPNQISATSKVILGYLVTNLLTYLSARGIITSDQVGPIGQWLIEGAPLVIALGHSAYVWWNTRKAAQIARVDSMPDSHVVTSDAAVKAEVPGVTLSPVTPTVANVTVQKAA
jgi:hypothetical protein